MPRTKVTDFVAPPGTFIPTPDDPLSAILTPGGCSAIVGNAGEEIPEEIEAVFQEHSLSKYNFRCTLKSVPDGAADDGNLPYIKSWARCVPTIEHIAREYGPGTYKLMFWWRTFAKEEGTKPHIESITFTISDKYDKEYRDYQFEKKIKDMQAKRTKVRDMRMDNEFEKGLGLDSLMDGEKKGPPIEEAAIKYVENVSSMAEKLGMRRGGGGIDWEKILPLVITGLPALFKVMGDREAARREESQRFMTLLMTTMSQNSNQMLDILKTQQPQRGADLTMELFDMIKGAIDVKEMIQGQGKETIADRIFGVIESVAPQLLEVAKLSAQQRAMDPRLLLANTYMKADKDFRELERSPMIRSEVIHRMDSVFGWRQTDMVLNAIGLPRNDDCPRKPEEELPADQRGPAAAAESGGEETTLEEDENGLPEGE